ncbi:hypothetical protein C5748_02175 [Phyllobacterium phragmitis]|uniref:Uncharacterized protein n=1 Tax=Phyllobacterium phragmitis TaxID=2670329 RepID=A0A2S9IX07_9HYPH|nr:hypothetical protein [Phyllobacterium phragmitis]PRD45057.1 hypothetical protein C5748_02175 [Phyllobacterium phragmitis]
MAVTLAERPVNGFHSWRDGEDLIELFKHIRFGYYQDFPLEDQLMGALQDGLISMLADGMDSEDLEKISERYGIE